MGVLRDVEDEGESEYPPAITRSARRLYDAYGAMDDDDRRLIGRWLDMGVAPTVIQDRLRDAGIKVNSTGLRPWLEWLRQERPWEN